MRLPDGARQVELTQAVRRGQRERELIASGGTPRAAIPRAATFPAPRAAKRLRLPGHVLNE